MKLSSFEAIVSALNAAEVRFIVVGGVAVNAHGYLRFHVKTAVTVDVAVPVKSVPFWIADAMSKT